jgi:hypothetical protein
MPFPWDRNRDRQVIEAALNDLMDPQNPENAIEFPAKNTSVIDVVLDEMTYAWCDFAPEKPRQVERDTIVINEAWSDLERRNGKSVFPVREIGLGVSWLIRYDDLDRLCATAIDKDEPFWDYFQQCHPNASGCLWVVLPGYSRDGRTAVVAFARPSYHGQYWKYVLHKTQKGWEVNRRERDFRE